MGKIKIEVDMLKCERCGHTWKPRKKEVLICPKCKSPYWNRPKQAQVSEMLEKAGK